ncbi:MAG: hypothetical protein HQ566_00600 [Candidatus Omnitrophica bacterium]|nr:hypothetical protein [Candidatus Omnitrophota bacterium]
MNKKQLSLLILTLFLTAYLINVGYMARATQEKLGPAADLKTYNIFFLIRADLNNDGREEKATIYRQWDNEGWYSDDVWYVICIFDEAYNIVYKSDVSHFQEVDAFSVRDTDGDGLKELIVSLNANKHWSPKTYTYGWRGDGYGVVE